MPGWINITIRAETYERLTKHKGDKSFDIFINSLLDSSEPATSQLEQPQIIDTTPEVYLSLPESLELVKTTWNKDLTENQLINWTENPQYGLVSKSLNGSLVIQKLSLENFLSKWGLK